ncbi:hypothetical protein B0H13DRAFT_1698452 [Mycena leptocephala]|nr:hypothetical protein B0H13DRAFT_1698452 [Mycena leptocephala]
MANHIPDEIISEILSPALRVSDATFSTLSQAGSGPSPFMTFSESSSAFLVVSKAWLRVATPLLYNVVVIRSKAQAQALAATLNANPDLGRFIKKLRVEGGFAISMLKILQSSPNITDIFLALSIAPSDNACGLCRGLPLIDPVRVIIDNHTWNGVNKPTSKLIDTLEKCFVTWKNMAEFEIPNIFAWSSTIPNVLSKAPNLKTLLVWDCTSSLFGIPPYIRIVAENPSLKCIRIEPPLSPQHFGFERRKVFYDRMKEDAKLRVLLDWADESPSPAEDEPPSSSFVYPEQLSADPVQEDAIWSRVLYFALYRDSLKPKGPIPRPGQDPRDRLAPLLVCKKFARLGVPLLYASPALHYSWGVGTFASQLAQRPHLGRLVRYLYINHSGDAATFKSIVGHTPALVELHGSKHSGPITWKAFSDVGKSTGSSLQSFHGIPVSKASGAVSPAVFAQFPRMREFSWDSRTVFRAEAKLIPADTFNLLVDLTVNTFEESFLDVLSYMELPSLRTASFPATADGGALFFQRHGAKLRELTLSERQIGNSELAVWRNCPSLTVLGVSFDSLHPVSSSCLATSDTHPRLERIVFKIAPVTQHFRLKQRAEKELGQVMSTLRTTAAFPALREVEHPCCRWPTAEPQISKSVWVRWAEILLERDVHLIGSDSVRWRPRLKFVPKTKQ